MEKYEILEHSADLKIRASGRTVEELFLNAMLGMEDFLGAEIKNKNLKKIKIELKASDLAALLVDFLSEVNYLNEVKKEIYYTVHFVKFSGEELEAELWGYPVLRFKRNIKAVTYHQLAVWQENDQWLATILFDI